jgi:nicotinamide riboside kinase
MTDAPFKFDRVFLASKDAADSSRLAHFLFAMALGSDVVIVPEDLGETNFWDSSQLVQPYRGSFSVISERDQLAPKVIPQKTLFCGADDRMSGFAERMGLPFLFVPTIEALPAPNSSKSPRRVAIVGPECSGKSTLAADLATKLATTHVPEYARLMLEFRGIPCLESDLESIMLGQIALEASMKPFANGTLICDTEPRLSKIYAEMIYGNFPGRLSAWLQSDYDQYLLTSPDFPWTADGQRSLPHEGPSFFAACERLFGATGRPVAVISGHGQKRLDSALEVLKS